MATILPPPAAATPVTISKAYAVESLQRLAGAAMMVGALPPLDDFLNTGLLGLA
jgi:hypothetical protein